MEIMSVIAKCLWMNKKMSKYISLVLGVVNAVCIVINIINQKWDVMTLNIISCVLCLGNFMASD